ncbi:hypothetical protein IFO70_27720 [Phormidium tenue FACHB-886]|nr:hypothetical protein [Phormidium tenue FACHB-886]
MAQSDIPTAGWNTPTRTNITRAVKNEGSFIVEFLREGRSASMKRLEMQSTVAQLQCSHNGCGNSNGICVGLSLLPNGASAIVTQYI